MDYAISPARLHVWKLMEFSGILPNNKRRALIDELDRKDQNRGLNADEKMILAADKLSQNKRDRRKFLRQELKAWEKIAPC